MKKTILVWILTLFLALVAMIYQRSTGPTYEFKGYIQDGEASIKYELIRTHETTAGAKIEMPQIDSKRYEAILHYKRYRTNDSVTALKFQMDGSRYLAQLPVQPAAGKIEYFVTGNIDGKSFRIPEKGQENIVLRYKNPVSDIILIPHVTMMIMVIVFGIRAGFGALINEGSMRKFTLIAFSCMTLGGMILGPLVQKSAFGEYWTGFPWGGDFTDNKMLIMWLAWATAIAVSGFKAKKKDRISRFTILFASLVMTVVYLIPHSMGGSTLDYDKVDQGIDPKEAIKTGAEN